MMAFGGVTLHLQGMMVPKQDDRVLVGRGRCPTLADETDCCQ